MAAAGPPDFLGCSRAPGFSWLQQGPRIFLAAAGPGTFLAAVRPGDYPSSSRTLRCSWQRNYAAGLVDYPGSSRSPGLSWAQQGSGIILGAAAYPGETSAGGLSCNMVQRHESCQKLPEEFCNLCSYGGGGPKFTAEVPSASESLSAYISHVCKRHRLTKRHYKLDRAA